MTDYTGVLLTVDFDRTLTAPDGTIPARNLEAIRYFMEHGGKFTVNTGRGLPMARRILEQVPMNAPILLYNGSAAWDGVRMVNIKPIQLPQARTLNRVLEALPQCHMEFQAPQGHYAFRQNTGWEIFSEGQNVPYSYRSPEDDLGPFLKFSLLGNFGDGKLTYLFQASPEECAVMDAAEKWLRENLGADTEIYRAAPQIIDVHARGVSKNQAAQALKARLGSRILVCVGDAENDIAMLAGADYGFCPADGTVADRFPNVCPCAEGAVAEVIYKKIPEILNK